MEKMINSLKKLGLSRYEAQAYIGLNKIIQALQMTLLTCQIYLAQESMIS